MYGVDPTPGELAERTLMAHSAKFDAQRNILTTLDFGMPRLVREAPGEGRPARRLANKYSEQFPRSE